MSCDRICRPPVSCNVRGSHIDLLDLEILKTNCTDNSLFVAQRPSTYSYEGNMEKLWLD